VPSRNADIVREMYEAFNRWDVAAGLELLHPEPELHQPPEIVDSEAYYGLEEFMRGLSLFMEDWDEPRLEPQRIEVLGADVLVQVRVSGTGRTSGIPLSTEYFHAWRLRDGRPHCCVVRSDGAEALEVLQSMPLRGGDDTEDQGPAEPGFGD
jgi:ketosteroid isomerase-like protein